MGDIPIDARQVVDELRASRRSSARMAPKTWVPSETFEPVLGQSSRPSISANDHLAWLHNNWDLRALLSPQPGTGLKGLARRASHRACMAVLAPYFNQLQEYLGVSVRAIDALARRLDEVEADRSRLLAAVRTDMIDFAHHVDERLDA